MQAIARLYGTNESAETEGAWMIIDEESGTRVKVRAQTSSKVRSVTMSSQKRLRAYYAANQTPPVHELDANEITLCADALIVDWEGFNSPDGKPVPCTREAIRDAVTKYPHFRRAVMSWSSDLENFRAVGAGAVEGN